MRFGHDMSLTWSMPLQLIMFACLQDRMFVSKGFQRIVEAEYDEGQHGSWREACTMFDAGVPSKVYTTPRNLLFSMLGRGASGEVH